MGARGRGRRQFLTGVLGASAAALGACASDPRSADSCPPLPPADLGPGPAVGSGAAPDAAARFSELGDFCADSQPISLAEFEGRVEDLRRRMVDEGVAGVVVESGADMRYLGGPKWRRSERPLLLAVGLSGAPTLVGSSFERHTYDSAGAALELEVRMWEEDEDPYARAVEAIRSASRKGGAIAVAPDTRSFIVAGLGRATKGRGGAGLHPESDLVDGGRRRKSPAELALLRRANEATKAAIAAAAPMLEVGMHERDFAALVAQAQEAAGLSSPWVLALFGPNAAHPHGAPEGRRLAAGDLVLVDTGGSLHGYASDITRTFAFPEPQAIDDERRRAWETVKAAQQAAFGAIRPGVKCSEVDGAARAVLAKAGYDGDYGDMSHRLGHGIGLQVHETPYLVRGSERVLEPGNTMSDEPGIYRVGEFGVRLEDIVAVTEDGAEVFGGWSSSLDAPF